MECATLTARTQEENLIPHTILLKFRCIAWIIGFGFRLRGLDHVGDGIRGFATEGSGLRFRVSAQS